MSKFNQSYLKNQIDRGYLRKALRGFYLRHIAKKCIGKTVDIGCGAGELLKLLPVGSIGFEINSSAVEYCQNNSLEVLQLPEIWTVENIIKRIDNSFETLVMNHVLEHIIEPEKILSQLINRLPAIGIKRFVIVVPGKKGFFSDKTHTVFIDKNWLEHFFNRNQLLHTIKRVYKRYFPMNYETWGLFFTHNEFHFILDLV